MRIPSVRYPSPLGRMQPVPMNTEAVKRSGWLQQHILVISPEDERLGVFERELVQAIGDRLYGHKPDKHHG